MTLFYTLDYHMCNILNCYCVVTLCSDIAPHVPDSDTNKSEVLRLMSNVTSYLSQKFPSVSIYPLLGNHDICPGNQQPGAFDEYYAEVLEKTGWSKLLNEAEARSFKQGFCFAVEQFCM